MHTGALKFARARDQFPGGRRVESESERFQVQVGALIRTTQPGGRSRCQNTAVVGFGSLHPSQELFLLACPGPK